MTAELSGTRVRLVDRIAVVGMGVINNAPYVIGIAAAQKIVSDFGVESYLGVIHWADTVSGVFSRFLFSWLISLRISYLVLFASNLSMMILGLLLCAFAAEVFWIECMGIFFIGFASNMGESVVLCYMSYRRKEVLLKSWGIGTGFAGVTGAGYALIITYMSVSNFWSFIGVTPVVVVYGLVFYLVLVRSPEEEEEVARELVPNAEHGKKMKLCDCSYFGANWWYILNCGLVYFFEYAIQGVFANCAVSPEETADSPWLFPLLNLCYQMGVLTSRSSLSFFAFTWVGFLTCCQAGMFCLWQCQAVFKMLPVWALCVLMVIVGLFGGCSYVNVFNLIMTNARLNSEQKEMIVSYNSFFVSLFIVMSTLFTFTAEMTFMEPYVPHTS